jgi:hypothetical protein
MKERPILMQADMVRAVLDGRKTQTRRVVTKQNSDCPEGFLNLNIAMARLENPSAFCDSQYLKAPHITEDTRHRIYPKFSKGDRLWVRETHARIPKMKGLHQVHYMADGSMPSISERHDAGLLRKYPSIHMPRWASRILLEITDIRVERVQEIATEDALKEGVQWDGAFEHPKDNFLLLWDSINAARGFGWAANPWVWVVEFKLLEEK